MPSWNRTTTLLKSYHLGPHKIFYSNERYRPHCHYHLLRASCCGFRGRSSISLAAILQRNLISPFTYPPTGSSWWQGQSPSRLPLQWTSSLRTPWVICPERYPESSDLVPRNKRAPVASRGGAVAYSVNYWKCCPKRKRTDWGMFVLAENLDFVWWARMGSNHRPTD